MGQDEALTEGTITGGNARLAVVRLGVLAAALLALGVALIVVGPEGLQDLLSSVGESRWGLVAFIAVYAIGVVLLLPGTMGTLTAGALFGFPMGAFAALAGATIGATGAFGISRSMGREGAQHLLGTRLTNVDEWIGRNDFASILVLRLMPIVPFNALNYAAGLAAVRPSRYVAASILGMLPGALLTTALADSADDPTGPVFLALMGLFLLALVGSGLAAKRLQGREGRTA